MKEAEGKQASERVGGNTFHVTGPNARVNFNSTDQSTNTAASGSAIFNQLHSAIDAGVPNEVDRARLKTLINEMETALDQRTFTARYQEFISSAADYITIIAPMLPALTHLITTFGS
jgi:hypothetical protein